MEPDADFAHAARNIGRGQVDTSTGRLEYICAAAGAAGRAIPVFGDVAAGRCGDERRGGRNIKRADAVTTRAAGIDERRHADVNVDGQLAHDTCRCRDFVDGLAFHTQRNQQARDLSWRRVTRHDYLHHVMHLAEAQVVAGDDAADGALDIHRIQVAAR